jgi:hypothetical protein
MRQLLAVCILGVLAFGCESRCHDEDEKRRSAARVGVKQGAKLAELPQDELLDALRKQAPNHVTRSEVEQLQHEKDRKSFINALHRVGAQAYRAGYWMWGAAAMAAAEKLGGESTECLTSECPNTEQTLQRLTGGRC